MKNLETVKKRQKKKKMSEIMTENKVAVEIIKNTIIHKILMKEKINKIKFVLNHKNREVKIGKKK